LFRIFFQNFLAATGWSCDWCWQVKFGFRSRGVHVIFVKRKYFSFLPVWGLCHDEGVLLCRVRFDGVIYVLLLFGGR
jgi:hypothetical protein